MKLTKTQLKQLIVEAVEEDWESGDWYPSREGSPVFDLSKFSETVSVAIGAIGSARVLEIVRGAIQTLEV